MAFKLDIPKELSHLKIDERGYPIPYFVSFINGKTEFRFIDQQRLEMIISRKVCHICGKKLLAGAFYFIAGPVGLKNRISTDAAMHRVCAEFSLRACPHLYLKKADRRDNDTLGKIISSHETAIIMDKPNELYLVKCDKYTRIVEDQRPFIRYRPVSWEKYIYEDNKLVKATTP